MVTLKLAYVQAFRDRHGHQRYYYRRDGQRFPLPGRPGEDEFMSMYAAAAATFENAPTIQCRAPAAGTFDALCVSYYRSPTFLTLRPSSQRTYRLIIDKWRAEHGRKRVTHLRRSDVVAHITTGMEASGPHAANSLLSKLKVLLRFAVENGWRRDDPAATVRKIRAKSEGFATWTEDDIAAFEKQWPTGTRQHLALALMLYTGQRRGDAVRMGRQHVTGDAIRVVQGKTGARLVIPMHAKLRAAIEGTPKDNLTFLMTEWGKPFSAAGFGNWFRDACDDAGLKSLSAHGLRKAAARRLAEAGCSASQIAAITGHRTLSEVTRYTAAADQEKMARDAIGRLN
jgi:integrase